MPRQRCTHGHRYDHQQGECGGAGVAAARAAGIPVVVTRGAYFADAAMDGAIAVGPGLHDRRGWQPALGEEDSGRGAVGLADIGFWMSHHADVERPQS